MRLKLLTVTFEEREEGLLKDDEQCDQVLDDLREWLKTYPHADIIVFSEL